jgi:hypothetical protein
MTILVAALVFFVVFGLVGFRIGAIRTLVGLIGVVLGAAMAFRFAPMVTPLYALMGITNPFYNWVLPPVTVFLLVQFVFGMLALFIHKKVEWFYKYKASDLKYLAWQRLNLRLGACVGLLVGAGYLVMTAMIISMLGYLTHQLAAANPQDETRGLHYINSAREDMALTGMDRALAAIDPTPASFMAAADLLGILYHNPAAQDRLFAYPAMLALAEKPEIKELLSDTQFTEAIISKPGLGKILDHPKMKAVFASGPLMASIYALDPKDMLLFVREGKSEIFDKEPILGRWRVDVAATLRATYLANPNISSGEIRKLKVETEKLLGMRLLATPDNQVFLRGAGLNAASTWSGAVGAYMTSLDVARIRAGKLNTRFDEVTLVNGRLQLRASADNFTVAFTKDI